MGQASNALWLQLHDSTITSSNFKKVIRRQSSYTLVFFDSTFKQNNIGHLPNEQVNESHAVQPYVDKMHADERHVAVQECGLCSHQEY